MAKINMNSRYQTKRLFVGIGVARPYGQQLTHQLRAWRQAQPPQTKFELPASGHRKNTIHHAGDSLEGDEVIAPENYHVTLCYLGRVCASTLMPRIDTFMAIDMPTSFTLSFDAIEVFEDASSQIVAATCRPNTDLNALHQTVNAALEHPEQGYDFKPHITLMRAHTLLTHVNPVQLSNPAPLPVTSIHLYSSTTDKRIKRYEPIASNRLPD